jgi:hypothetical protein
MHALMRVWSHAYTQLTQMEATRATSVATASDVDDTKGHNLQFRLHGATKGA